MMSEPRGVSIIVVNYNNARFLAAAIDSALGQDHSLFEVIVVDDCSTDNSQAGHFALWRPDQSCIHGAKRGADRGIKQRLAACPLPHPDLS